MKRDRSGDAPKTAEELMNELERDPEFLARAAAKEETRLARVAVARRDAEPVLAELATAGFAVANLRELLTKKLKFKPAIPILLTWLPTITNHDVKESIVRVLTVPFAKPIAARPLINEFRRLGDEATGLRWAIGNALEIVADDSVLDEMIELAQEPRYAKAREMIVVGLGNMKNPQVIPVLLALLNDQQVSGHAVVALGKLKSAATRASLEPFLKHPKPWIRKEAEKAIGRIDKAKRRS